MGNVFTLDSLREEAEKKFAPVVITLEDGLEVTLRNLLRLPKKERLVVMKKLKELDAAEDDDDVDTIEKVRSLAVDVLKLVADKGTALAQHLGDDIPLTMRVLEVWMETSQPGEAKPSPA